MFTKLLVTLLVISSSTSVLCAASDSAGGPGSETVVAEVNGVKLTLADLEKKHAAALFQARATYYDLERKVVQSFIDDYVLEQQARKEGLTVSQLLDRHVNAAIAKDPSEEALRVYYEGVDTNEPYDSVRGKILDALKQRRIAKARASYLQSLRSQSTLILRLAPPRAPISMKDVPVRGEPTAPVTVLEFADYECSYCQQIHPVLQRLEKEFAGKIAFAYKDYPLPMHASAPKAAEATHCAGAQGKYWEYHDILFEKKQLTPDALKAYARELKLDTGKFEACLDAGQMGPIVSAHVTEAQSLVLQGTPTILINGRLLSGDLSYERLRAAILEELSAVGGPAQPVARGKNGER
jgi:protein-disulfide isomerase